MEQESKIPKLLSASELLDRLFTDILAENDKFDLEVVALVKTHLGMLSPHSKAGSNLATSLIELAKKRASRGQQ